MYCMSWEYVSNVVALSIVVLSCEVSVLVSLSFSLSFSFFEKENDCGRYGSQANGERSDRCEGGGQPGKGG